MERHSIQVSYRLNGMRLDAAISESIPGLSRRRAKAIVDMGGAYVNKKRVRIASKTVGKGDRIDVEYNERLFEPGKKEALSLKPEDILYFENDIIIINKPAGLHVIPLLDKLLGEMGHKKMDLQLVHRLDKDTTGALVIATNKDTMTFLTDQFRQHTIQKTYHAIAWGVVEKPFEIKCMLSAIQPNTGKVKVVKSGGKSSQTFFEVIKAYPGLRVSLVTCRPITGRSHQIRVHLDEAGHPIVGDKVYGEGKRHKLNDELLQAASHQLLHAASIRFQPTKDAAPVEVTAPYPESFASFLRLADSL